MISVSTVGILILKNNFNSTMERQIKNSYTEHNYIISNTNNRIIAERLNNNSILLNTAEIINVMQDVFNSTDSRENTVVALFNTYNERLYGNGIINIDVNLLNTVQNSNEAYRQIISNNNEHFIIIASPVTLEEQSYILVTSTNITDIYDLYNSQLEYTKLLCIFLPLACAIILLILVKMLLRPLVTLNNATYAISSGDYSKRINIKTHDELGELAENMNKMADSIEENVTLLQETADNRKQFINNLSHEMKTPLTSILGFADIIRIKRNISSDELSEYIDIIFEEATRLKSLSGKLMEIITVGETNLEFTDVLLSSLLSQTALVFSPVFEKNEINLVTNIQDCNVNVDKELFKSMLFNIVDNAVKASHKNSNIYINSVFSDDTVKISITDEGIGIDQKELNKILEPFYMVDKARSRKAGGAGLGLALCNNIAKIHNAVLTFESELEKGTTVTITMKGVSANEKNKTL
jgi:signal transduction histidine kinase